MYKSIIFDIGGVLVDFDPKAYLVDRLCNAEMEEKVYDLTFGSEEWQLLDAGKLSRYDGNQRMLEHARAEGCAFEVQGVLDDWLHILRPRHRMEELVRRLKSHGYCVYYLSNIPQDVLDLLRDRGVLDGFDGNYMELSALGDIGTDVLKLDLCNAEMQNRTNALPGIFVQARTLRLNLLAEGIESAEQLNVLRKAGCTEGQGYFFSRPLSVDEFAKILKVGHAG